MLLGKLRLLRLLGLLGLSGLLILLVLCSKLRIPDKLGLLILLSKLGLLGLLEAGDCEDAVGGADIHFAKGIFFVFLFCILCLNV